MTSISPELNSEFDQFLASLKTDNSKGSYSMAKKMVSILNNVINANDNSWKNCKELIDLIYELKNQIIKADPTETVPANIIFRLLKIIRDEYQTLDKTQNERKFNKSDFDDNLQRLIINDDEQIDYTLHEDKINEFRNAINDGINELTIELEESAKIIAKQSLEHIYSNELILTLGKSNSVESFLKYAAKKNRKVQVVVAECSPFNNGHDLAIKLAKYGINTTLIPDSAIFAIMSRVNKVVIGTHSVMANGGLKAISGAYSVALAAKHYSVPLIVCTPMFKLTPQYLVSHDQVAFNKFSSPHQLLPFKNDRISTNTEVVNPVFDYVPPELVSLFVSNIGSNCPSYVYRLLAELYHNEDYLNR